MVYYLLVVWMYYQSMHMSIISLTVYWYNHTQTPVYMYRLSIHINWCTSMDVPPVYAYEYNHTHSIYIYLTSKYPKIKKIFFLSSFFSYKLEAMDITVHQLLVRFTQFSTNLSLKCIQSMTDHKTEQSHHPNCLQCSSPSCILVPWSLHSDTLQ